MTYRVTFQHVRGWATVSVLIDAADTTAAKVSGWNRLQETGACSPDWTLMGTVEAEAL